MPFETPSLPALIARTASDIEGSSAVRRSDAAVLSRVHSAAAYAIYEYLAWQFKQQRPDTADEEYLLKHGEDRGVPRKQPTYASGYLAMVGNHDAPVDAGVRLDVRGVLYEVTQGAVLTQGAAAVAVQALEPGASGNLPPGTQVQLVSPVLGVNSTATVDNDGLTGGTDLEDLDDYRARVVSVFRKVPHGGNADDYVTWALEQPGVTRAWCKRNWVGPGTVAVFVVNDARDDITLTEVERAQVLAGIAALRPVTAELSVLSPELVPVDYTLGVTPDTPRVRAAVVAELQALHERNSEMGERLLHTHIGEAISGAAGETDHNLVSPAADVVPEPYQLLVFGGVAWL